MNNASHSILNIFKAFFAVTFFTIIIILGSRLQFQKNARSTLLQTANQKILEFESGLNSEITIALQMAKSPTIVAYLQNPNDSRLKELGTKEIACYQDSFASKESFYASEVDLRFYSNGKFSQMIDVNNPDQYWWKMTIEQKVPYNFNINYNEQMKKIMLWLNATVRNSSGRGIGMVGTGIPLSNIVDTLFVYRDGKSNTQMYTYNSQEEITGSYNQSQVENKILITTEIKNFTSEELHPSTARFFTRAMGEYLIVPITSVGWNLIMYEPFTFTKFIQSCYMPLVIILLFFIAYIFLFGSSKIIGPLKSLKTGIDDIATGNADLTKRIAMTSSYLKIVNKLVIGFNTFIEKLQDIMYSIKTSKDTLVSTGSKLRSSTKETTMSIDGMLTTIKEMETNMNIQSDSVQDAVGAINQISSSIESLDKMISTQANTVSEASAAITQMIGNIASVNSSVENLSKSFEVLEKNTSVGMDTQADVGERIRLVKDQSEMLQEANLVISSIAEQTNLLAMNAAIEAAHAGEAGKGFSVVADEIRKLSETSASQSKTIGEQLHTIQESIEGIVNASEISQNAFNSVSEGIHNTDRIIQEITTAMKEQEIGSKQINDALHTVNDSTYEVKTASNEMTKGNTSVLESIKHLENSSHNIQKSMYEMKDKAHSIETTSNSLATLSDEVDSSIKDIGKQIDLFKV